MKLLVSGSALEGNQTNRVVIQKTLRKHILRMGFYSWITYWSDGNKATISGSDRKIIACEIWDGDMYVDELRTLTSRFP